MLQYTRVTQYLTLFRIDAGQFQENYVNVLACIALATRHQQ